MGTLSRDKQVLFLALQPRPPFNPSPKITFDIKRNVIGSIAFFMDRYLATPSRRTTQLFSDPPESTPSNKRTARVCVCEILAQLRDFYETSLFLFVNGAFSLFLVATRRNYI